MLDYYEMGARIAALRKENAITQEKLAEILDISVKHCSEVERGVSSLSLEKLIYLSDFFIAVWIIWYMVWTRIASLTRCLLLYLK